MKNLIKRMIVVILFAIMTSLILIFIARCSIKNSKKYKYLTLDNEWGESNNCYFQDSQLLVCEIENNLIGVKQYYEE